MSATTTQASAEAATPPWLLPLMSFASSIYIYVLLALALVGVLATLAGGLSPHVISTGSMEPAIKPGDIVLTDNDVDAAALGLGTVITYDHPARPGTLVTHRIVGRTQGGGYETRGDANSVTDSYTVSPKSIVGAGRLVVPLIGLPATWLRHGMLVEFALFMVASVIAFAGASLRFDDEPVQSRGVPRGDSPVRPTWEQLVGRVEGRLLAIGASAVLLLTAAVALLVLRSGALVTDSHFNVGSSAAGSMGLWRLAAVGSLGAAGGMAVRVALPGGRWEAVRDDVPRPLVAQLAWIERNGAIFVGVLAVFVLSGAGTALAHTATGSFVDAAEGGQSVVDAHVVGSPSNPSAAVSCNGTSPEVAATWTASDDPEATGYEILRSTTSGGSYGSVGSVSGASATAFTDAAVSNSTTYYYVVRTTTATSWVSPWTSEVSATTPDCSPPDMWISSLTGSSSAKDATNWTATATAQVSTDAGVLSGATVSGEWSDLTGTLLGSSSCMTDTSGTCSVSMDPLVTTSEVTFTVTGVSESGHEYVSSKNATSSVTIAAP